MYENGIGDWRVYSAEQAVGMDEPVDLDSAQQLVDDLVKTDWWQDWFPNTPPVEVVIGGNEWTEQSMVYSYASTDKRACPTKCTISLHSAMLSLRVLLHELAHCAAPSLRSQGVDSHGQKWPPTRNPSHGPLFTATLQIITDRCFGDTDDGELLAALTHYCAPIASHEELRAELEVQPALHRQLQDLYDELDDRPSRAESAAPLVIPTPRWGFHLEFMRREHHRRTGGRLVSQIALAKAISVVYPCTARHISQIENSPQRPEDPAQLKRAMLATIFLGMDPIWTRYQLGLTRWDCGGITMKEARLLNKDWAALVSQMNRLLKQMPPHWFVEGSR